MGKLAEKLKWLSLLSLLALSPACAQSVSLLPNAEQQFVDQNGQPYGAGKVYSYIPNTLTPKTTWSDPAGSTPNSDPVVLDNAGRAVIYGTGIYRQILKDVFGNTIWDKQTQGYGSGNVQTSGTITGSVTLTSCNGFYVIVNGSSAPINITMPTSPNDGDSCQFVDTGYNASQYQISFLFGAKMLTNGATAFFFNFSGQAQTFTWNAAQQRWIPY